MKALSIIIFIFVFAVANQSASAGMKEGEAAFARGDNVTAEREFRPLAERGNLSAQVYLGTMYANGMGVPHDDSKAIYWYTKAAQAGNISAQKALGIRFITGQGVQRNFSQGAAWLTKAFDQGDADSAGTLGYFYEHGTGTPINFAEAINWYRRGAEKGDFVSKWSLAEIYEKGNGVPRDLLEAKKWYGIAGREDDVERVTALIASTNPKNAGPADGEELICSYPGFSKDRAPVIVKYRRNGQFLVQLEYDQKYRILQDTPEGFVAVWSIAETESGHRSPSIGTFSVLLNKSTRQFMFISSSLDSGESGTSVGNCLQ